MDLRHSCHSRHDPWCDTLITGNNLFGVKHEVNYFIVANSLLLLGILCVLAKQGCIQKKD